MKALDRAAKGVASIVKGMTATNPLPSSSLYRGGFGVRDYTEAVNAQNAYMAIASVFACLTAYATNEPQVKKQVQHLDGEPWPDHPAQWILQHPNDDMGERELSLFNSIYKPLGGKVYQHLLRGNTGQVIGFRSYPSNEIAPVPVSNTPVGRNSWTEKYYHTPAVGAPKEIASRDIVALRFPSINPLVPQGGLSPLAAIFLDINQDKAVTQLPTDLMNNGAFMSYAFMLGDASEREDMPDGAMENIVADIQAGATGSNRFKTLLVRAGGSVKDIMPDFRKMDWAKLGERPELRICAGLRVPIRYVGFSAGIDASTSDNYIGSWLAFIKDSVLGNVGLDCDILTNALVRESWANHPTTAYGCDRLATSQFKIVPDTSEVQALKTEQLLIHADATQSYAGGGLTKDEYRHLLGKPPVTDGTGDEFYAPAPSAFGGSNLDAPIKEPNSKKKV